MANLVDRQGHQMESYLVYLFLLIVALTPQLGGQQFFLTLPTRKTTKYKNSFTKLFKSILLIILASIAS